jgi:acyl transferase domain-containing protein/NAD(P)-dependent dehydrogenase (short-subunit alcohol dehydrogenase family)/acyl carrier protein
MDKIAIVGMGALFPDALNLSDYWNNILNRKDSLQDVPDSFWNVEDYYDPDPNAEDKTYGKRGGFIKPLNFDSMEFGIPPKVMEATSVDQLFGLLVAKQAFEDAGLLGEQAKAFNRERTGVILAAGVGKTAFALSNRLQIPRIKKLLLNSGVPEPVAEKVLQRLRNVYLDWSEQSNPGYLANVVAGRISNRFNLGGTNCSVDAACASSFSALKFAVQELLYGSCDIMLTGGVNLDCSVFSFVSFSKTPAISPSNLSRPFDKEADGMMLGDGIGMFVLKRLPDAERDNDRIYAIIRGIGSSSDGRAKSIFAPNDKGQLLALERAYEKTDVTPASVSLIEAHGTGTVAGDKVEISSLNTFFQSYQIDSHSIGLGSVKSQIGHTRLTAGAAGMMKAVLALYHKVLPPTINVTEPNPALAQPASPLYLLNEPRPWITNQTQPIRRAAVNAFGFGGTNFHVVLEEYEKDHTQAYRLHLPPQEIVLHASSKAALITRCNTVKKDVQEGGKRAFYQLIYSLQKETIPATAPRIGMVAANETELTDKLDKAIALLEKTSANEASHPQGIYYRAQAVELTGKVVALFPGQGSQYAGMGSQMTSNYPELRTLLESVDTILINQGKRPVSALLYPASAYSFLPKEDSNALTATEYTQPALAAVSGGLFKIMSQFGFKADFYLGHSFGELTSLWAAGALTDADFAESAAMRGKVMSESTNASGDQGSMLALVGSPETVAAILKDYPDLSIANYNADNQTIVAGSTDQIEKLAQNLASLGLHGKKLTVSAAFHTPYMAAAQQRFEEFIRKKTFLPVQGTVYCNATGQPYVQEPLAMQEQFSKQILNPVLFKQAVEHSYQAGGRVFVEIGPKKVLSSLVDQILKGKEKYIISLNPLPQGDAEVQFREALVQLKVLGMALTGDPYQKKPVLPEDKTNKPGVFEIHPEFFYTEEKTQKINQALEKRTVSGPEAGEPELAKTLGATPPPTPVYTEQQKKPHAAVTAMHENGQNKIAQPTTVQPQPIPINQHQPSMNQAKETQPSPTHKSTTVPDYLIEIQKYSGSVLQEFLKTQAEQMKVVKGIMDNQYHMLNRSTGEEERSQSLNLFGKYVDFANHLQHNSFHVYQSYFSEQSQLIDTLKASLTGISGLIPLPSPVPHSTQDYTPPAEQKVEQLPSNPPSVINGASKISPVTQVNPPTIGQAPVSSPRVMDSPAVNQLPITTPEEGIDIGYILLSIISDKTGYPQEMLELDMNLEADLGIDSIKRVQIFSSLNDQLPRKFSQEDVEALAGISILKDIIDFLQRHFGNLTSTTSVVPVQVAASSLTPSIAVTGEILLANSSLTDLFLSIISDKTGYPQEMLELDMNLEADLGIDSIKRVQIFSSLNDQLPRKFSQEDVEALAAVSTIQDILAFIHQMFGGTVQESTAPALENGNAFTELAKPAETSISLSDIFLHIVSDKTGYPQEMLELDMNLEADLGIDSIKRVQIFSSLNDQLPRKFSQSDVEALAGLSTIYEIIAYLEENLYPDSAKTRALASGQRQSRTIKRFEVSRISIPEEATILTNRITKGAAIILINDGQGVATQLAETLLAKGVRIVLLNLSASSENTVPMADIETYTWSTDDESHIDSFFKTISDTVGDVTGLIYLMPNTASRTKLLATFDPQEEVLARKLFFLAKYFQIYQLQNQLSDHKFFVTVTRIDGSLGLDDTFTGKAFQASLFGLTKSVKQEWEPVFCRAIDIHPAHDASTTADLILKEIELDDDWIEVGRDITGNRHTLTLREAYHSEEAPQKPNQQDVFLVPGGGRGITAQCVLGLAQQFQCKFILLGRTEVLNTLPEWAVDSNDKSVLRQAILAYYKKRGETIKPLEIDRLSTDFINQREIKETIQKIKALGGDALYQTCNVTDAESVTSCIRFASQRFGPITGFIHGAGNLADKKIQRKTLQDYEKVFDTKVKGLEVILNALDMEPLKYIIFFSSIAAYFGSGGQCDYSMANEILNKFAFDLHKLYPHKRVCSINWGPWAGGMVTDTLKMVLEMEGVKIIEPETGVQYLLDELQYGLTNEICQIVVNGSEHFRPAKVEANLITGY